MVDLGPDLGWRVGGGEVDRGWRVVGLVEAVALSEMGVFGQAEARVRR